MNITSHVDLENGTLQIRADGDADLEYNLPKEEVEKFESPVCPNCGSHRFKPNVVFFGDQVPKERMKFCTRQVSREGGKILVVGSSLQVGSAWRLVDLCIKTNGYSSVFVLNNGATRLDEKLDDVSLLGGRVDGFCAAAILGDVIPESH